VPQDEDVVTLSTLQGPRPRPRLRLRAEVQAQLLGAFNKVPATNFREDDKDNRDGEEEEEGGR